MKKPLSISQTGIDIIKGFEGFEEKMYYDVAGKPTIGYGTLIDTANEQWLMTAVITREVAEQLLKTDLRPVEKSINTCVKTQLNQNQFDALCSFAYNVGTGNFARSTLLKKINENPNGSDIHNQFVKWIMADGEASKGLLKRRNLESELYFRQ